MTTDILKTDWDWAGQDVYVVGSGKNGAEASFTIPSLATIIVVNKAIKMHWIIPDYWLCATPALTRETWFQEVMRDNPVPIIARYGPLLESYPDIPYCFLCGSSLWADAKRNAKTNTISDLTLHFGCTNGYLRGGASACARALQLAWFKKAKRCVLIGADMKGRQYFDGTVNKTKQNTMDENELWFELPYFSALIKWVKERGMDVVSLTPTALDVEVIDAH